MESEEGSCLFQTKSRWATEDLLQQPWAQWSLMPAQ